MLFKPCRPRDKRIAPARSTYSIEEFCEKTGQTRAVVLRLINDGTLRTVRLGYRRLILTKMPGRS
jgi:excisionase family DNA binding protein